MCIPTVLVIDDDDELRALIVDILEELGYGVAEARHGLEALDHLERGLPTLILLDMKMPVMDGWKFAHEMSRRHCKPVPVVVMTAASDAARRAADIGAAGYLPKPFSLDALIAAVQEHAGARCEPDPPGS